MTITTEFCRSCLASVNTAVDVREACVTDSELVVELEDGRTLSVPISWYPRLAYGTPEEHSQVEVIGSGVGMHWPLLDEDVSVEGLLAGWKSGKSARSLKRWRGKLDQRRQTHASGGDPGPWVEPEPLPEGLDEPEADEA